MKPLLDVTDLAVTFKLEDHQMTPVRGVSLQVKHGERVAIVGESGCGKSLSALSLARLSPTDRAHLSGAIMFDGQDTLKMGKQALMQLRGRGIAYVFQDSTASLNPVMRVRNQIAEALPPGERSIHNPLIVELLAKTGLPDPQRAAKAYPCELSGGQQQRVMLALALALRPRLLVADEPTTALDVTTQQQVLDLIDDLADTYAMAVLLITHNLGLVAGRMQRVYVMYAGEVVETGDVTTVLTRPLHPYTIGLLAAVPVLDAPRNAPLRDIPGTVPAPDAWPTGCAFAARCTHALPRCFREAPPVRMAGNRQVRCWLTKLTPADEV